MAPLKLIAALLVSFCVLLPLTHAVSKDVSYCDKNADYAVKVTGLDINPYPIARGKPASFNIAATTGESITGGKLVIDVSYFGWHIHSENHDLCSETSCPVSIGDFVVAHSQELPGYTPPGSYSLKMKMYDGNKQELTCIAFDFDIGFAASVADS
ncbi:putative ML domain, phosphatidylinositol/phosphatidylglycerol transfer protein [Rosa chinensis]|uniref:Putative ML domain, phosphatidylinositol/phosphatidylglycerol transfer protein n=1 Tax=Rosa chinensis TaxID=74649 RepID=A0A2P6RCN8_ROSCH|nr:putative phosphatidylglycerol/phosphatidylinositol transfer protein DDB_G0282179 [Rosa chinensis]PRQ44194.1 putative ML domain, phosphatidylinositol/phosphatidylglycerol transfer protein [Rosa chinensis]